MDLQIFPNHPQKAKIMGFEHLIRFGRFDRLTG
jgi:hypothetical protein